VAEGQSAPAADYIDDVPPGAIVAIDNGGRTHCTVWGDILTFCAQRKQVAGTVIYGCCRDTAAIIHTGYPLFSLSSYMKSGKNRVRMTARQVPIALGPTQVAPGDVLLCDDSGVLAIPSARVDEVLAVARQIDAMEARVIEEVKQGTPLKIARERNNYNSFAFQAR
jgi:regulator of RNase E activity RraA